MSFLSLNTSFNDHGRDWEPTQGLGLTEQVCNVSQFLLRMRMQLRYGEFSRAPLKLLRLNLADDAIECDWIARAPDRWDLDLPRRVRMRHASLQTLRDAIDVRSILFRSFPSIETANLRVFRATAHGTNTELIVSGCVQRNDNSSRWVHSLTLRARNLGFRFFLEDEILSELPVNQGAASRLAFPRY